MIHIDVKVAATIIIAAVTLAFPIGLTFGSLAVMWLFVINLCILATLAIFRIWFPAKP